MRNREVPLLELQNVRVMRGETIALDDFTLRVDCKEHVAILGPNGSGKSTLIKTITRECYPVFQPESRISILGRDRWNVFELRSMLGIISNDVMTMCRGEALGRDVVLSGFFSSSNIFPNHPVDRHKTKLADQAMEQLGVLHLAGRPMDEMSSGEAKRVLIARALVHEPHALLFDEPSNSLDIGAQHELRQTMRTLASSGIGIILVTHELPDIIPEIERVVLMAKGRIVADGHKEEILTTGHLTSLFGAPVEIGRKDGYYHLW
jgi:iron complex transport system ATP-binding protein